jgi:hypothetical protein
MKILNEKEIESIIETLQQVDDDDSKLTDPSLKRIKKYVDVLTDYENEIIQMPLNIDSKILFYSRYYWFNKFKKRYYTFYGHDEGLEQQSYKILEQFNTIYPNIIDWAVIEKIENE